jgi:hypothetical protein
LFTKGVEKGVEDVENSLGRKKNAAAALDNLSAWCYHIAISKRGDDGDETAGKSTERGAFAASAPAQSGITTPEPCHEKWHRTPHVTAAIKRPAHLLFFLKRPGKQGGTVR